ncbi:MAG: hypothetical protein WKG01_17300 [Kofleriaceae bacterium]
MALAIGACSSRSAPAPATGRVIVALTIDWEGAYLSPEGLDALEQLRTRFAGAPLTHYISAAYFTKQEQDPKAVSWIQEAVQQGDELAVHLHAWRTLAKASGIEPKLAPSFLSGTDKLMEFEDGDVGFDVDLDAYGVAELRSMVKTSRRLLEQLKLPLSKTFRAAGYLGTPKVLQAIHDEGFTVDSSATDHRQLDERADEVLPKRIHAIWPKVDTQSQPFSIQVPGGQLLEMPIAAFADYATSAEMIVIFDAALARLRATPTKDVFVVLGFHQETAEEFGGRLADAIEQVRARKELADVTTFTTLENAAERARKVLAAPPK